jgi:serine protease Do
MKTVQKSRQVKRVAVLAIILCGLLSTAVLPPCCWASERREEALAMMMYAMLPGAVQQAYGQTAKKTTAPPADFRAAIGWVAQKTIPAVVHIEVSERQEINNPFMPFENDPFFKHFFDMPRLPKKFKREMRGLGTGMIIDDKGHIITNNHVVGGAQKIQVLLASGKQYKAKLIGKDPKTDLAVIKIEAKEPLPCVTFGDSDKVKVGDWVVAIGHPRGLDQTVTQGIISAKHRNGVIDPSTYQDFLQTDAAINPGNSGGPLLTLQGEVIGVNAAIASESGGFEGIGFSMPSNMAVFISRELISRGKIERGWLGVSVQDLTPDLAKSFGVENDRGALIADVSKNGPAQKAGIKRGDVVVKLDGEDIPDSSMLRNKIALTKVGKVVTVTVLRSGKQQDIAVTIGNLVDEAKMLSTSLRERLGITVRQVTEKEVKKYNLDSENGVVITGLDAGSAFKEAGFEVGDLILEINNTPVTDVESFVSQINSVPAKQQITILALDHKSGDTGYVQVVVK